MQSSYISDWFNVYETFTGVRSTRTQMICWGVSISIQTNLNVQSAYSTVLEFTRNLEVYAQLDMPSYSK
jgi:hypothetical protein